MSDDPTTGTSEPTEPGHLDDEALSALADGEATPAEIDHVAGCPACQQRVDQFLAVGRLVREPVPSQAPADADAAVTAALAAAEQPSSGASWPEHPDSTVDDSGDSSSDDDEAEPEAAVVPLRKRRFGGRQGLVIAAAAAVLVAVVAVGAIALSGGSSKKTTALSKGSSSSDNALGAGAGAPAAGPSTTLAAPTTTQSPRPPVIDAADLGSLSDPAALVAAVKDYVDNHRTPPPTPTRDFRVTFDITLCAEQNTPSGAPPQFLLLLATVTWKGTEAVVLAKTLADPATPTRTVVVLALDGCATLLQQTF